MTNLGEPHRFVPKAVVFDMGGVLIDLHSEGAGRELTEKYGILSPTIARLTRSCFDSQPRSITELAMIGQVGTTEYLEAFLRECSIKDLDGLRLNRLSVVGRERKSVFAVVQELKRAGFICCVLSNTIALHWEKLTTGNEYPSLGLFDHVFASHLIKCAKPEMASFLFVADALNIPMSECLLVDDTPLNVDCAKAAGWQGLLFRDATQLRLELSDLLDAETSNHVMKRIALRSDA
jgi:FMN phosphatase YigB (HAD superfamily)